MNIKQAAHSWEIPGGKSDFLPKKNKLTSPPGARNLGCYQLDFLEWGKAGAWTLLPLTFHSRVFWTATNVFGVVQYIGLKWTDVMSVYKELNVENSFHTSVWYGYYAFQFSSVQFSRSVMSDCLWHHESQHARPPCPSPTPRVHSDSSPSSQWCHLILCCPLLLLPPIPPSIRVFSNESTLHMRWPKYWVQL